MHLPHAQRNHAHAVDLQRTVRVLHPVVSKHNVPEDAVRAGAPAAAAGRSLIDRCHLCRGEIAPVGMATAKLLDCA